jgi:HSP20 family protein
MTMLTRYGLSPFSDLASLQDRMNRMFNETFSDVFRDTPRGMGWFTPAADLYEDPDHVTLKLEVPGFSEKDLRITLENNVLSVQGERQEEEETKGGTWHRRERFYGTFNRSFALPPTIDPDSVEASCTNGILELRVAKKAEAKPKQIPIGTSQKQITAKAA